MQWRGRRLRTNEGQAGDDPASPGPGFANALPIFITPAGRAHRYSTSLVITPHGIVLPIHCSIWIWKVWWEPFRPGNGTMNRRRIFPSMLRKAFPLHFPARLPVSSCPAIISRQTRLTGIFNAGFTFAPVDHEAVEKQRNY